MTDSPLSPARFLGQIVTLVAALSLLPAAFAAGGPPPITVNEPVAVTVTGPVEVQGAVEILNDSLRTIFNKAITGSVPSTVLNDFFSIPAIPAGKRLVVEGISISVHTAPGAKAAAFFQAGGKASSLDAFTFAVPLASQGVFGGSEYFTGTQRVRIVIDPRYHTSPQFVIYRTGGGTTPISCSIAAYLEDLPVAP